MSINLSSNDNIFVNASTSSIDDIIEVAVDSIPTLLKIKTKTKNGQNSIFVEAFQAARTFSARPNFNYYDQVEKRIVKPSIILQAHLTCSQEVQNILYQIIKENRNIKFEKIIAVCLRRIIKKFSVIIYI